MCPASGIGAVTAGALPGVDEAADRLDDVHPPSPSLAGEASVLRGELDVGFLVGSDVSA